MERLYGIQHGATSFQGNQFEEVTTNNSVSPQKTQEQLAKEFGISVDTLRNYKLRYIPDSHYGNEISTDPVKLSDNLYFLSKLTDNFKMFELNSKMNCRLD